MCDSAPDTRQAATAVPRAATGSAVDPIALEPVDEIVITTLVDNVYDGLLADDERTTRAPFNAGRPGPAVRNRVDDGRADGRARVFRAGQRAPRPHQDHVAVRHRAVPRRDGHQRRPPRGRPVPDPGGGSQPRPLRPRRRARRAGRKAGDTITADGGPPEDLDTPALGRSRPGAPELPTLSKRALEGEGFAVIERREPSLLVDGCVLITGEVDRTTEFEHGMPAAHQELTRSGWQHDPLVIDDQALVVHVRGRGLVVLTGCGHAGAINIVRYAQRLTAVPALHALVGGLHLNGPAFEPIIGPTVAALTQMAPGLVVPGHCTGWRAQHALAAALPAAWPAGSSGSSFRLAAA